MIKDLISLIRKFIPPFLLSWYHFSLAFLSAVFYGFPSRLRQSSNLKAKKIKVIGVTGTNGKSTVVEMCHQIFREANLKVASLSSIRFKIDDKEWPNTLKMTMPGRFKLQKFLRQAVKAGCQYVVLEVTSEGIKQHRHKFVDFDVAVLTNLTPEHIESHGSFEKYREAKAKLFRSLKRTANSEQRTISIINLDDENANYFLQFLADEKYGYTINREQRTENNKNLFIVHCSLFALKERGVSFVVENTQFNLNLLSKFNVYNALAAICVELSQGIDLETCKRALENVKEIPGRMEIVIEKPFKVIVDYAHTPDALERVYKTLSNPKPETRNPKQTPNSKFQRPKLICILGSAGGGRDKWKRPALGQIAAKYCDEVVVTNEDPYDEDPMEIIEQVAKGAFEEIRVNPRSRCLPKAGGRRVGWSPRKSASIHKILDRREAIKKALEVAKSGDVVIITGKGSEPWMCVAKGKKIPWDDRMVAREEFQKLKDNSWKS